MSTLDMHFYYPYSYIIFIPAQELREQLDMSLKQYERKIEKMREEANSVLLQKLEEKSTELEVRDRDH